MTTKPLPLFLLAFLAVSDRALAADFDTPEAVIAEMQRLVAAPCDLACQLELASMHAPQFLSQLRKTQMKGLEDADARREATARMFGRSLTLARLRAMSDEEFVARQWLHTEQTSADWVLRKISIVSEHWVSDDEVVVTLEKSGMKLDPDYKEEAVTALIRDGNGWKIKY